MASLAQGGKGVRPEDKSTSNSESTEKEEEEAKKSSSGSTVTPNQSGIESDNENQATQPPGKIVAHTPSTVTKGGDADEKSFLGSKLDEIADEIENPYLNEVQEEEKGDAIAAQNLFEDFDNTPRRSARVVQQKSHKKPAPEENTTQQAAKLDLQTRDTTKNLPEEALVAASAAPKKKAAVQQKPNAAAKAAPMADEATPAPAQLVQQMSPKSQRQNLKNRQQSGPFDRETFPKTCQKNQWRQRMQQQQKQLKQMKPQIEHMLQDGQHLIQLIMLNSPRVLLITPSYKLAL